MTYAYRFVIDGTGIDFVAPGKLTKGAGCYVVEAQVSFSQAMALKEHQEAKRAITLWVEVNETGVGFMPVHKVRATGRSGQIVDVAAIVYVPDVFAEAMKR